MVRSYGNRHNGSKGSGRNSRGSRIAAIFVVLVLLAALGAGLVIMLNACGRGNPVPGASPTPNSSENESLNSDKFYNGVFVDDIPLGGLTRDEAKAQIEAKQKVFADTTGVTVTKDTASVQFKISDTAYTFDTDAVLDEAWKQGREGTTEERLNKIRQLPTNNIMIRTTVTADPSALEQRVRELAAPYLKPAVDAAYLGYDVTRPDGQRLSFSPDVPGEHVDADALWAAVKKEFDDRTFGTVAMQVVPLDARIKLSELQPNMQLVRRWYSTIKDHSGPRLTNIKLASAAVSGKFILPGDVLSFNDTTGQRTSDKGYQMAHVINAGVTDNGLAGGTCQVSGTLWNTVVRADLEIVERYNHTLKSAYLKAGEDATVDFPRLDLKIKNNKDTPVLLIMYIKVDKGVYHLYGEVYGVPLEPGVTIELNSVKTSIVPAPAGEARYVASDAVKIGTTETNKARNGEKYTTYKLYMKGGKEMRRVEQHKSYYPAQGMTIVYNPADGIPTPTPSPSLPPTTPKPTVKPTGEIVPTE